MAEPRRKFGLRDLWRSALWGLSAAGAVYVAVYAATTTEIGRNRLQTAVAEVHEILLPTGVKPVRPLDAREGRRLAETVRQLSGDRDRLLDRLASLEQNVDGITGSIARVEKAARPAEPAPEPELPQTQAPAPVPPEEITSSIVPPESRADPQPAPQQTPDGMSQSTPLPPRPPGSSVSRTEFGLDLGGAATVEALRTAWISAVQRHGTLIEGLRPVVGTRDRGRPGMEFRLIAGPVPNAATAARLCAAMTAAGAVCAPAVFEGQRLAVR